MGTEEQEAARAFNARTAERYDAAAYAPQPEPMLDIEKLFGLGALYGCRPQGAPGVLDIGCGSGMQLERAAGQTRGSLVGTDISAAACKAAEAKLAGHTARTKIIAADILDLDAEALGRFDVIYCVGVLYVVPPLVRARILDLIGACLKPGGVVVISYYAGAMGLLRAEMNRMIRAAAGPELEQEARLDAARAFVLDLANQFPRGDASPPGRNAQEMAAYSDRQALLHESLCEEMTALRTSELQAALSGGGLHYLGYLHGMPYAAMTPTAKRAALADVFDYAQGGYRYAVFGKAADETAGADGARAGGWSSVLRRQAGSAGLYQGPADYRGQGGGGLKLPPGVIQAAVDELAQGPRSRAELHTAAKRRLAAAGAAVPADAEAVLDAELIKLWPIGGATPLWLGAAD